VNQFLNAGGGTGTNTTLVNVASGTLTVAGSTTLLRGAELDYGSGSLLITGLLSMQDNGKVFVTSGGSKVLRVGG